MPERKETFPVISGVGVVVENEQGQILMKKRKDSHGKNEWALPGGKIDFGETFEECALRELKEETNLEGQATKVISLSNQRQYLDQGIHCVIIGVKVHVSKDSRPQNKVKKLDTIERIKANNATGLLREIKI